VRFVVENGSYHMDNLGDVAMLQVCVGRILERWPDASVRVLVETPDRLRAACPGAEPLRPSLWHRIPMTTRTRHPAVRQVERHLSLHHPRLACWARRRQVRNQPGPRDRLDGYYGAIREADAVVCSGGGFLNDHHVEHGDRILHTLGLAQGLGKPTAMLGAGLGPLETPSTRALARRVAGRLSLLGLREREGNLRELERWGARPPTVEVTGDDAVELARPGPPDPPGSDVGVSLRLASEYGTPDARGLGEVLRSFARTRDASLIGLPVRTHRAPENDVEALATLFGADTAVVRDASAIDTTPALLAAVDRCRVVVTGTYHAGVFALSRGIPVVALSGTRYYDRKLGGLAEQFGTGVVLLRYDQPELETRLRRTLEEQWTRADEVRGPLLEAAARQRRAGREAYRGFFDLVAGRRAPRPEGA
jgi:colanic acid/amylovoran biosynthesis protein